MSENEYKLMLYINKQISYDNYQDIWQSSKQTYKSHQIIKAKPKLEQEKTCLKQMNELLQTEYKVLKSISTPIAKHLVLLL